MIVDTTPGEPDCIRIPRDELEYLLSDFYASGRVFGKSEEDFAIIAVRARGDLRALSPDEFYPTLHQIIDRSKEL